MGRTVPMGEINHYHHHHHHPFLLLSLMIASVAATMALLSFLCGALWRKKPPPESSDVHIGRDKADDNSSESRDQAKDAPLVAAPPFMSDQTTAKDIGNNMENQDEMQVQRPLPLPPALANPIGPSSYHGRSNSMASSSHAQWKTKSYKLSSSLSMKVMSTGLASLRQGSKREDRDKKYDKKLKHEDSIWKKRIILGEKCRVPDDDEEDTILYDEKGNRISAYRPKQPPSLPVSRQTSDIDPNAIPS